ncbi:entericidin A/B family lipoprotein [Achromobacter sp. Marseille-Q0513]|jgi:predicted small secreted protein|nr:MULTISPECIES: entericidin A/B family lipoprotein [unclassified Achromobacter]AUT45453.1 entericidin [Achromobacter sp. AONIH1]MBR8654952.1 entericidin A/B family lipoprotein [Achromobacter sp. Marseille-Q0513]
MAQRIWIVLVMAVAGMTAGCNTVEGAGKDIERGGEKIQQQAR